MESDRTVNQGGIETASDIRLDAKWFDVNLAKAEASLFGESIVWLVPNRVIAIVDALIPSIIVERYDKKHWTDPEILDCGRRCFGNAPFHQLFLKTASGVKRKGTLFEITPRLTPPAGFEVLLINN